MKADDRLSMYRLVDRLGKGGFAEVWRARPEPAQAQALRPDPAAIARWLRALTELLLVRDGPHAAARPVVHHLAEVVEALDASRAPDAPAALRGSVDGLALDALRWVEELAASGDLDVALKVPFHDGYVRQMRREKDILRHVPHPRLVRQLELDLASEPPFLAMELVRGWSLREALKTEPLPPMAKILAVMDQLLTVLDHLHRRGMVHGDVKPENIMLEPDGSLRLIDLGLGQVSQAVLRDAYLSLSLASRVPLQGTLSYMAPEVRRGEEPGPAADLFSAGILLYEMLVGDVPHGMTLPSEAATQRELTPRFDVLLKWVLHPEPARRIPSARELRERVLITMRERTRHKLGTGVPRGVAREGTLSFDQWALEHASPFVQGDWLGDFQLEEPLGRGGFGEVWRGRKAGAPDHEVVALKIAIGPHGKDALVREAEVTGRLDHPQIPRLVASALEHDPPYLAIEFVPGRSLRARMNADGPMSPHDAMAGARSLVDALMHCHGRGVVHRDLKPENLLLAEPALTLHLLDFGLASAAAPDAQRAEVSGPLQSRDVGGGTYEYMAPERRRGEPGGTPADVYAVGAILYEALTLELPRGLTRLRELCPAASGGLEALVERLLDADPARRPTLAEAKALLDRERPRDEVRPRARPGGAARRRALTLSPRSIALAVAAGLALVAGSVQLVLDRRRPGAASDDPVARLAAAMRRAADAPSASVGALRSSERDLLLALDPARELDPQLAARAELRLARVGAVRRRREEAITMAEQASWRLSRATAVAQRLRDRTNASVGATISARAGLEQLADATELLRRALALDPACPRAAEWRHDVATSSALVAAWRAEVLDRELFAVRRAAEQESGDELRTVASLLVEQLEAGAVVDPRLRELGPQALGLIAAAYERRIARDLEARELARALLCWQRLMVIGDGPGLPPLTTREATARHIAEVALRVADGRRLVALSTLPGVSPASRGALLEDAARLLPPGEAPTRALARARGAREAEGLDPATCAGRARRLLWEELDSPDHALAMAELAARTSPGRPEVLSLLAACQALAGDAIAGRATSRRGGLTALEPVIARYEAARAAARDERGLLELEAAGWALREAAE